MKQTEMGCIDILGRFVCTFELATYTILLLTDGSSNNRENGSVIYFGTGGEAVCVMLTRT
jgi:hypothetical protein